MKVTEKPYLLEVSLSEAVQDHLAFSFPDELSSSGLNFNWRAEPAQGYSHLTTIQGPQGANLHEWVLDGISDQLDWAPGKYKILVDVGSSTVELGEQEVGIRSDNVLAIAWIDPDHVTLNTSGTQSSLPDVFKVNGLGGTTDNDKLRTGLLVKHISEDGVDEGFQIDLGPLMIGRDFDAFSLTDKTYALNWMFHHAGNDPPPESFIDGEHFSQALLDQFIADEGGSRFKLLNHYQVKYLVDNQRNFQPGSIVYLKKEVIIGNTKDPAMLYEISGPFDSLGLLLNNYPANGLFPGVPGANNSLTPVETTTESKLCNEGRPDQGALDAFKNLTGQDQGEIWSSITFFSYETHFSGSSFTRDPQPTETYEGRINTQVYPTYWIYINGVTKPAWKQVQAPQPSALFPNTDICQ